MVNIKKFKNIKQNVFIGVILFISTLFISQSLIYPVVGDLFDNCSTSGFLVSGTGFECEYTPFVATGLLGGVLLLITLGVLGKGFGFKKTAPLKTLLLYILLTVALGIFWRETMIATKDVTDTLPPESGLQSIVFWIKQPLSETANIGYSYLNLWLNVVAGMIIGTYLGAVNSSGRFFVKNKK